MSTIYITFCLFPSIMVCVFPSPRAGREFAVFFEAACRHPSLHVAPPQARLVGVGERGISALSDFFAALNNTAINTFGQAASFFFFFNSFTYLLEYCSLPSLRSSGETLGSPRRGCSGDGPGEGGRGSSGRPGFSLPSRLPASTCPAVSASPDWASFRSSQVHQRRPVNQIGRAHV